MSDKPCSYLPIFDGHEKIKVSKDDTNYNTITDYMNNIMPDGSPRFTWVGRKTNESEWGAISLPNNEPDILSGLAYWDDENKTMVFYNEETHNWLNNNPRPRRKTPTLNFNN